MKERIHIVPGNSNGYSLEKSFEFNPNLKAEIICLNDHLGIGPITGLDGELGQKNRRNWVHAIAGDTDEKEYISSWFDDYNKIEYIKSELQLNKEICIWFGKNTFDILMFARLIWNLRSFLKNIFVVPMSECKVFMPSNNNYVPESMAILTPDRISRLDKYIRPINQAEINQALYNWEIISQVPAHVRTLTDAGEFEMYDETYYDDVLLSNCKSEFQKSARVIGHTLCDIDFDTSDITLNWRLKSLVKQNILEANGIIRNMREYEVKLITEA